MSKARFHVYYSYRKPMFADNSNPSPYVYLEVPLMAIFSDDLNEHGDDIEETIKKLKRQLVESLLNDLLEGEGLYEDGV